MAVTIPREYQASVVVNTQLTPKIFWLTLAPTQAIPYVAGQYGSFLIDAARRPLSFATPSGGNLEFVVDISPAGIASQYVEHLRVGDAVKLMAPYGQFVMQPSTRPLVFIAAGSGIGPIRAMILDLLNQPPAEPITLFFGNRAPEHMFFLEEFAALATRFPTFTFIPASSVVGAGWTGAVGHISDVATEHNKALAGSEVYVCGGPVMVAATLAMLAAQGVPPTQIHTEKFA